MEDSHDLEKKASLYASRRLRELRGELTQEEFGARIGMKSVTLSSLEVGRTRFTLGRAVVIARALNVSPTTFVLQEEQYDIPLSTGESTGNDDGRTEST